ncbi:unnamed protein product [Auanema sp. JU1783]|nr:unnamed protein product [Auanema sp. JU1783]
MIRSAVLCREVRTVLSQSMHNMAVAYDNVQLTHMKEPCIEVDEKDNIIGSVSKLDAHCGSKLVLHRAFSVFAFTPKNELILQKRSDSKITFPSLWTNACCSHPLFNDSEMNGVNGVTRAAIRKLNHELGITGVREEDLASVGRFLYKAQMKDGVWGEHEMDYVLVLRNFDVSRLNPNPEEVSDVRCVSEKDLYSWLSDKPSDFTPWFLLLQNGYLREWWKDLHLYNKDEKYSPEITRLS